MQIIPEGRAYLTSLESLIAISRDLPFKPRTPSAATADDLAWWLTQLDFPSLHRLIPHPVAPTDLHAFSDASIRVGIGIVLDRQWCAWTLTTGWKSDARDIGWAEAVGFELLVYAIIRRKETGGSYRVYGDNQGVVEG